MQRPRRQRYECVGLQCRRQHNLSVRKNDADCILSVTAIVTADGPFLNAPGIPLNATDTFQVAGSPFALAGNTVAFYGNAKISSTTFASDYLITLAVSDTAASEATHNSTGFAVQSATVVSDTVPAPNHTLGLGSFGMIRDAENVVDSVSGAAVLASGGIDGQQYAIFNGPLTGASTLSDVETAWSGAAQTGLVSALPDGELDAAWFDIVTLDLDDAPQRTVLVRNEEDGVYSYQLLLVTFAP